MAAQLPVLADLASIFQLTAGVSFAMSTFRAPYERLYHRLGSILDREEIVLANRNDVPALEHSHAVVMARSKWRAKGRDLEPIIAGKEGWIWLSVFLSCCGLVAAALWPNLELQPWLALGLLAVAVLPMLGGIIAINLDVQSHLANLRKDVEALQLHWGQVNACR